MSYAQFDEDVLIDRALGSPERGCIVDVGAGDGMEISNSRLFRERGWMTVLVEPDPRHREALLELERAANETRGNVHVLDCAATPQNINRLVGLASPVDVLSIDVDGDDYFLLDALEARPEVIVVEHNPTMPYDVDVAPARLGLRIGASVAALARVACAKGYGLYWVTHCNAIFRLGWDESETPKFRYRPAYHVATEYFTGRPVVVGTAPWGVDLANPYPSEDVIVR